MKKNFIILSVFVLFFFSQVSIPVSAQQKDKPYDTNAAQANEILFYNPSDCSSDLNVSGAASAGSDPISQGGGLSAKLMEIKDASKFAQAIDEWIKNNSPENSPFRKINAGELAVAGGKRAGINPILPIIIARMESSFGVATPGGNNAYGRTATPSQPNISAAGRLWYSWDSLEQSLYDTSRDNDMYMYIKDVYSAEIETGIEAVMMKYAPPSENDTSGYLDNLKKWANEIYDLAGDSIDKSNLGASGDTSPEDCDEPSQDIGDFVIYYQDDFEGNVPGCGSIVNCGCGPTSLAMILATLLGDNSITPVTLTKEAGDKGLTSSEGIGWTAFTDIPTSHGLKSEDIGTDMSKAKQALSEGKFIVMSQSRGIFTSGGHIVVLRGLTSDGMFLVADPNKKNSVKGNQACSAGSGICATVSKDSSQMTDLNGDGVINYTENEAGFTSDQIAASLKGMWVISKE